MSKSNELPDFTPGYAEACFGVNVGPASAAAPPRTWELSGWRGRGRLRRDWRAAAPSTPPHAADKAGGPSANKTAPKTERKSEQAHAAHRKVLDFSAGSFAGRGLRRRRLNA